MKIVFIIFSTILFVANSYSAQKKELDKNKDITIDMNRCINVWPYQDSMIYKNYKNGINIKSTTHKGKIKSIRYIANGTEDPLFLNEFMIDSGTYKKVNIPIEKFPLWILLPKSNNEEIDILITTYNKPLNNARTVVINEIFVS